MLTRRRRRALLIILALLGLGLLAVLMGTAWLGERLSRPMPARVGPPPASLGAESLSLPGAPSDRPVAAWFVPGRPGAGAVLLLHGLHGDRRQMLGRAAFLQRRGHALLLIDLPGHGESPADRVRFGAGEAVAVRAALAYLHQRLPQERVGVIGVSLGAAALVLARPEPAPAAVVLESMYPGIEDALENRLRLHLGDWAPPLAPLLLWQLPWQLGLSAAQLQPIQSLPQWRTPLLLAAGGRDRHTTLPETAQLFAAAPGPGKSLWVLADAAHVDLHAHSPAAYEQRVGSFLAEHLQPQARP